MQFKLFPKSEISPFCEMNPGVCSKYSNGFYLYLIVCYFFLSFLFHSFAPSDSLCAFVACLFYWLFSTFGLKWCAWPGQRNGKKPNKIFQDNFDTNALFVLYITNIYVFSSLLLLLCVPKVLELKAGISLELKNCHLPNICSPCPCVLWTKWIFECIFNIAIILCSFTLTAHTAKIINGQFSLSH